MENDALNACRKRRLLSGGRGFASENEPEQDS
jgi:hypothetical protein